MRSERDPSHIMECCLRSACQLKTVATQLEYKYRKVASAGDIKLYFLCYHIIIWAEGQKDVLEQIK